MSVFPEQAEFFGFRGASGLPSNQTSTIDKLLDGGTVPSQAEPITAAKFISTTVGPQLAIRSVSSLRPHPSLRSKQLMPSAGMLMTYEKLGDSIFEQPVVITHEGIIVDGYPIWLRAKQKSMKVLLCLILQINEDEALCRLIQTAYRTSWLNSFNRVELALDREDIFRRIATANQSGGGRHKGSLKLTGDARMDCRKQVAILANVSPATVTHAKTVLASRILKVITEARRGSISISRAAKLCSLSSNQRDAWFGNQRMARLSERRTAILLRRHRDISFTLEEVTFEDLSATLETAIRSERFASLREPIQNLLIALEYAGGGQTGGTNGG